MSDIDKFNAALQNEKKILAKLKLVEINDKNRAILESKISVAEAKVAKCEEDLRAAEKLESDFFPDVDSVAAHMRWYKAEKMLSEARKRVIPWAQKILQQVLWTQIFGEMEAWIVSRGLTVTEVIEDDFDNFRGKEVAYFENKHKDYLEVHHEWFAAIKRRSMPTNHMQTYGSRLRLWPDRSRGPVELAKLFTTSMGSTEEAQRKASIERDFDIEALCNIIRNCKAFWEVVGAKSSMNVGNVADGALKARHLCRHAVTTGISEGSYTKVKCGMRALVDMINNSAYEGFRIDSSFIDIIDKDDKLLLTDAERQQYVREHEEYEAIQRQLEEETNKRLRTALSRLLPCPPSEARRGLLFESCSKMDEVQKAWCPDSRKKLLADAKVKLLNAPGNAVWLYGGHGSGKSSAMARLCEELQGDAVLIRHFFVHNFVSKDRYSASLEVAVKY